MQLPNHNDVVDTLSSTVERDPVRALKSRTDGGRSAICRLNNAKFEHNQTHRRHAAG